MRLSSQIVTKNELKEDQDQDQGSSENGLGGNSIYQSTIT